MRLARKTSPLAKGRPLRQIQTTSTTKIVAATQTAQYTSGGYPPADSPVTTSDVKLIHTVAFPSVPKEFPLPHRAPGSPGHSKAGFLTGKPITYYRPKGSAAITTLVAAG